MGMPGVLPLSESPILVHEAVFKETVELRRLGAVNKIWYSYRVDHENWTRTKNLTFSTNCGPSSGRK